MARMTGKAHRSLTCPYGCCDVDFIKPGRKRRLIRRRAKRIEARIDARDAKDAAA